MTRFVVFQQPAKEHKFPDSPVKHCRETYPDGYAGHARENLPGRSEPVFTSGHAYDFLLMRVCSPGLHGVWEGRCQVGCTARLMMSNNR
jgi:hypothetical protein